MKEFVLFVLSLLILSGIFSASAETLFIDAKTSDRVHLRQSPDVSAPSLGLYFTSTPVTLLSSSGDWAHVQIGAESGYVYSEYLSPVAAHISLSVLCCNHPDSYVNLRSAPSLDAEILARLDHGQQVLLLGQTASGWNYVLSQETACYAAPGFLTECSVLSLGNPRIVGTNTEGDFIFAYDAPNEETLYFVSMENEPVVEKTDVNFDGMNDLVIHTARGASNQFSELFVFDGASYRRAKGSGSDARFANFSLYPEENLLVTYANNGYAGALHEKLMYRWNGHELELLRSAVSALTAENVSDDISSAKITYHQQLHLIISDFISEDNGSSVVFESIYSLDDVDSLFQAEEEFFWNNLR